MWVSARAPEGERDPDREICRGAGYIAMGGVVAGSAVRRPPVLLMTLSGAHARPRVAVVASTYTWRWGRRGEGLPARNTSVRIHSGRAPLGGIGIGGQNARDGGGVEAGGAAGMTSVCRG